VFQLLRCPCAVAGLQCRQPQVVGSVGGVEVPQEVLGVDGLAGEDGQRRKDVRVAGPARQRLPEQGDRTRPVAAAQRDAREPEVGVGGALASSQEN